MNVPTGAYLAAINSMDDSAPRALQPLAAFIAEGTGEAPQVTLEALRTHLADAGPNDLLVRRLHMAILRWDGADGVTGAWAEGTQPHTGERRKRIYELLGFNDPVSDFADQRFARTGDGMVVISDEFEPWYTPERRTTHEFYWPAYEKYLLDVKHWDPDAVRTVNTATTRVVERLSDPTRDQAYQSKGMVVGYVQSGKTANFTGVLAKAIDAGYRLIIVLTGTIDLLRKQTQRRLDMELVGVENIFLGVEPDDPEKIDITRHIDYFQDQDRIDGNFLKHGFQPSEKGFTDIVRLTRHGSDYRGLNAGITALELEKRDRQKPLFHPDNLYSTGARLAVVKKNAAVLRKLVADLKTIRTRLGEIPTLIVDDESDQASVNTSDPRRWLEGEIQRTSINKLISELLGLLPRAQYLGYTATPYANVFIDPGDAQDIFPKDFLISLDPPPDYMGLADFHDLDMGFEDEKTVENSNEKAYVRDLNDITGIGELAETEMQGALDSFLLAGALKLFRESRTNRSMRFRHHTMLVHESMRTQHHREQAELVRQVWKQAGYMTPTGLQRLEQLLEQDFRPVSLARAPELPFPTDIGELRNFIGDAMSRIQESSGDPVLVVNGDKDIQQQNLDFDAHPVWRVLVGGAKLSRGFTVEGLTVSYFRRAAKLADALMQMGRWFGYRSGYRDLVRLYVGRSARDGRGTIDLYEAFEAIVRDEEAFRAQLERYAQLIDGKPQMTPRDIPPLVSQHLPTISPSARNKMFNAELVIRRSPGEPIEPTAYPEDPTQIAANYTVMLPVLLAATVQRTLTFPAQQHIDPRTGQLRRASNGGSFSALTGIMSADAFLGTMEHLQWLFADSFRPDLAYLQEITGEDQVHDWVVIAPQLQKQGENLEGVGVRNVFNRERRRGPLFGALSDPKHRPAAARIAQACESWGDEVVDSLSADRRGAVIVYPVVSAGVPAKPGNVVFALTLFAPRTAQPANGQVIQFRAKDSSSPHAPIVDA